MPKVSGQFRFNKHDSVGANAAEDDENFLADCFVDTGDLELLLNLKDPRCIACGRTGSGKSALLQTIKLKGKGQVIEIRPESLSFNYIANSTIIRFFIDLGVNLDPFFKLLWRHITAVEIIRQRFRVKTPEAKRNWFQNIFSRTGSAERDETQRRHHRAIKYLERYGDKFWEETEYRSKEIAAKFEKELHIAATAAAKSGVRAAHAEISADVGRNRETIRSLSVEERAIWVSRGQSVMNSVQVQELEDVFSLINELLDGGLEPFLILIDRLDDSWVDDSIRLRLIRALIDTAREFRRVEKAKIIVALREDLLERVLTTTRTGDAGFQEEKFKSLTLRIAWDRTRLVELLDRRVAKMVSDRYTKAQLSLSDIMKAGQIGSHGGKQAPVDYILDRTWMRPRDVIEFINTCLQMAAGKSRLTGEMILAAESEYSRSRFQSLGDEWSACYPGLLEFLLILKKKPKEFRLGDITDLEVDLFCVDFIDADEGVSGRLAEAAREVFEVNCDRSRFRAAVAHIFYLVGACGLKTESYTKYMWHSGGSTCLSPAEISDETRVSIHPALWRKLGVDPR